jgi:hypothetical protein
MTSLAWDITYNKFNIGDSVRVKGKHCYWSGSEVTKINQFPINMTKAIILDIIIAGEEISLPKYKSVTNKTNETIYYVDNILDRGDHTFLMESDIELI